MPRTSYLQQIARRADSNLPLLQPPHSVIPRGRTTPSLSQDVLAETRSFVQRPSTLTVEPNSVPFIQSAGVKEHKPILSDTVEKTAERGVMQEITPRTPNPPLKRDDPTVLKAPVLSSPGNATEVERSAPPIVSRQPHMGTKIAPAKPPSHLTTDMSEPLPAAHTDWRSNVQSFTSGMGHGNQFGIVDQIISTGPVEKSGETQFLHTRPPSISQQRQAATARSARSLPIDGSLPQRGDTSVKPPRPAQITLVPLPAAGPAAPMGEPRIPQGPTIHIGSIDVQIMPSPVALPAPATVQSTAKSQSAPALSREFTSSFGLRQG